MPLSPRPVPPTKNPSAPGAPTGAATAALPLRSVALWSLVALAVLVGILLYFRHERSLMPLVG